MFLDQTLRKLLLEAITKQLRCLLAKRSETRQCTIVLHELDDRDDTVAVLACSLETLAKEATELSEWRATQSAEYVDVLERQLKRRGFETHIAWAVREHETEVDVYEVTFSVEQDIAVVPVLDL